MNLLSRLWCDERGSLYSAEVVILATILVIGVIPGIASIQHALVNEMNDFADAISGMDDTDDSMQMVRFSENESGDLTASQVFAAQAEIARHN